MRLDINLPAYVDVEGGGGIGRGWRGHRRRDAARSVAVMLALPSRHVCCVPSKVYLGRRIPRLRHR